MLNSPAIGGRIDLALDEVGRSLGIDLAFDDHRVATLECGENILCTIEAPDGAAHVYFHAPVTRMPEDGREAALSASLQLNLFSLSLAGASLALDAASDELLLCYAVASESVDGDLLAEAIVAIVDQVRTLREALEEKIRPSQAPALHGDFLMIRG